MNSVGSRPRPCVVRRADTFLPPLHRSFGSHYTNKIRRRSARPVKKERGINLGRGVRSGRGEYVPHSTRARSTADPSRATRRSLGRGAKKLISRFRVPVASPFPIGRFAERRIERIYDQPSPTMRPGGEGRTKLGGSRPLALFVRIRSHPYA